MLKARKPLHFRENDLSGHALYSIVTNKRAVAIRDRDFDNFYFKRLKLKMKLRELRKQLKAFFSSKRS